MSLKTLGGLFNGKNKSHNQKKLDQCLRPTASISDPRTLYNADPESRLQWALFGSGYRGKIIKQESFKKNSNL